MLKYDTKTNSFVTPEMKMVEDMVSKDPMADLLDLEDEEMNQMQESTDSNEQQAEKDLLLKFNDTDQDSVHSLTKTHDVSMVVLPDATVNTASDNVSTTSSLTNNTAADLTINSNKTPKATGKSHLPPPQLTHENNSISSESTLKTQ